MSNLFISHSSRDNTAAKELQSILEEQGHRSVFLDLDPEVGIQTGVSWERTLYTKLRACRAVVALCSDNYLNSQWCFAEIALARMEGKELFVLQIDPWGPETQMPSILTEEQFIDIRTNQEEGYQRLWNGFKVKGIVPTERRDWRPDDPPYPGLRAFHEEDAPVFFGRDAEVLEGTELLNKIRRQGHPRLAMVLGASGSGKSSLVRAGIVPQLRRDKRQWTIVRPFRPGQQPMRELSAALSDAFASAGQAMGWEEIYRWLQPEDEGELERGVSEVPSEVDAILTPNEARERLLQALSVMEGELSAAGDRMMSSVRNLKHYLNQQQTGDTRSLSNVVKLEKSALVDIGMRLRLAAEFQDTTVVLVIDQFEELLGHDADHSASRFLEMLRTALEVENSPFLTIGTMRSDYLGLLQASVPLQGLGRKSLSVGPMAREGMRQIIEEPAKLGQIQLEDGLTNLLLDDTASADALPLLAFTLRIMWDRYRDDRLLEISEYKDLGGLQGAVALVAEESYQDALDHQPDDATRVAMARELRDAFLSMARPAAEVAGWSRQPVNWSNLSPAVQPLLESFIDPQRLLVKREDDTVEVAHEALFRSWDRLKSWLDENAESLHLLDEIRSEAKKWSDADVNSKAEYLWTGGRLARAQELRDGGVLALDKLGAAFIDASVRSERAAAEAEEAARKAEQQRKLDAQRQRRNLFAGAFFTSLIFLAVAGYFWRDAAKQKEIAQQQLQAAQITQSRFLAREAEKLLAAGAFSTAIALARRAMPQANVGGWPQASAIPEVPAVLASALRDLRELSVLKNDHEPFENAIFSPEVFSPDGAHIITATSQGQFLVWNSANMEQIAIIGGNKEIPIQFSPDGSRVLFCSKELGDGRLTVSLIETDTWKRIAQLSPVDAEDLFEIDFSSDGRLVLFRYYGSSRVWDSATDDEMVPSSSDHAVKVYDAVIMPDRIRVLTVSENGKAALHDSANDAVPVVLDGPFASLNRSLFSPDGRKLYTQFLAGQLGNSFHLWDADGGKRLVSFDFSERMIAEISFSPGGSRFIREMATGTWLLDTDKGAKIAKFNEHLAEHLGGSTFSPDGNLVLAWSTNGTAGIWNAKDGEKGMELKTRGESAPSERWSIGEFSPDSTRALLVSEGGIIGVWDTTTGKLIDQFGKRNHQITKAAFTPDGTRILTFSGDTFATEGDRTVRIWDARGVAEILPGGQLYSASFWGDSPRLVGGGILDGTVLVWNGVTWDKIADFPDDQADFNSVTLSPDSNLLFIESSDGKAWIWNRATKKEIVSLPAQYAKRKVDSSNDAEGPGKQTPVSRHAFFSPDSEHIIITAEGLARVWNVSTGESVPDLFMPTDWIKATVVFSLDGTKVLTGSSNGTIIVWDASTWKKLKEVKREDMGTVLSAVFTPDVTKIISGSDGSFWIWDLDGGKALELRSDGQIAYGAAFSPNGTRVVTKSLSTSEGDLKDVVQVWEVATGKQLRISRGVRRDVRDMSFSPDGSRLLTSSIEGTTRIWQVYADDDALFDAATEVVERLGPLSPTEECKYYLRNEGCD